MADALTGSIDRLRVVPGRITFGIVDTIGDDAHGGPCGGVAGAIHPVPGPEPIAWCRTPGVRLPTSWLIHMVWHGGHCSLDHRPARRRRESRRRAVARDGGAIVSRISPRACLLPLQRACAVAGRDVPAGLARYPSLAAGRFVCLAYGGLPAAPLVVRGRT